MDTLEHNSFVIVCPSLNKPSSTSTSVIVPAPILCDTHISIQNAYNYEHNGIVLARRKTLLLYWCAYIIITTIFVCSKCDRWITYCQLHAARPPPNLAQWRRTFRRWSVRPCRIYSWIQCKTPMNLPHQKQQTRRRARTQKHAPAIIC